MLKKNMLTAGVLMTLYKKRNSNMAKTSQKQYNEVFPKNNPNFANIILPNTSNSLN